MLENIINELSKPHNGCFKILLFIIFASYSNTVVSIPPIDYL